VQGRMAWAYSIKEPKQPQLDMFTIQILDCAFVQWGKEGDRAAIQASSGSVLIRGCEFLEDKHHNVIGEGVSSAVVSGNLFHGQARIENLSKNDIQIGMNAGVR